ncbi:CPL domain [Dillenia turbinata]|uniref:CPL domain n=1 Tax=Dillenia turbinata TaxID=194707 RepID=A0AAN8UJ69_9MAGN
MAAKNKESKESKKRKRSLVPNNNEADNKVSKKPKTPPPTTKDPKKPFDANKRKPFKTSNWKKSEAAKTLKKPKTKREGRLQAKELAEDRKKKRKRHYTLEQELGKLWEKMRRHNIAKEERSKLVSGALQKMKGKIPEIAGSHVSSRVLQTCVKHASHAERDAVYEELRPHFLMLANNTYAVHLVKKMLDTASKTQLADFISSLHGHVARLLRSKVGSMVIEHVYQLGNASEKGKLLIELYSTELQLFKDLVSIKESRLVDIIPKLGLQRASVVRYMSSVIQPILEKDIVDHSILHRALLEFFSIADRTSAAEVIQKLSGPLLVRVIGTKDGSKVGILCVKHGSAKERKKIIKGMKGLVGNIVHDQYGSLVLVCILSTVDDTKLVTKEIIRELMIDMKKLVLDKSGRCMLLQLLHPNHPRYFTPDDQASLNLCIPSLKAGSEVDSVIDMQNATSEVDKPGDKEPSNDEEVTEDEIRGNVSQDENLPVVGGKKDPSLRRQELLLQSGLAESLVTTCIQSAAELLESKFGKEVLYEVATGGEGGILNLTLNDKIEELHGAIASLAALPKSDEASKEHVLENFHSSRTIRRLVLDCPAFASTLWKSALEGRCEEWAHGHRLDIFGLILTYFSAITHYAEPGHGIILDIAFPDCSCKVVNAFLESSDSRTSTLAKGELQPLLDQGILKMPETKDDEKES